MARYQECKIKKCVRSALKSGSVGDGKQDIFLWCLIRKLYCNEKIIIYRIFSSGLIKQVVSHGGGLISQVVSHGGGLISQVVSRRGGLW